MRQKKSVKPSFQKRLLTPALVAVVAVFAFIATAPYLLNKSSNLLGVRDAGAASTNPLYGLKFGPLGNETTSYANDIAPVINSWSTTRPTDAAILKKMYSRPIAEWLGEDWAPTTVVASRVNATVTKQVAAKRTPVFVVYSIPNRDCGSYSAGGSTTTSYMPWVQEIAKGINNRKAVVILEPDALALASCLSATDYTVRLDLIKQAMAALQARGALVYLEVGNARWLSVDTAVKRLQDANVAKASGFTLNVANFYTTSETVAYGDKISSKVNGKRFIIDTSRNGKGPYLYNGTQNQWCNPPDRAVGKTPNYSTGYKNVDAVLWIKTPGRSDGLCTQFGQNDPKAGTFMPEYALTLAKNAGY